MKPKVSFVIPAYNEARYIEECLGSIVNEARGQIDFELIVIDNGSSDETARLAKLYTDQVYSIERSSVSKARNYGAGEAVNDIIAFIDADVTVTSDWINQFKNLYASLHANKDFITGSQCLVPPNGTWIERHWFSNLTDQYLGGANIVTSKEVWENIAGFDESLKSGEDYDFCVRAIGQEVRFVKDDNFKAIHLGFPKTLKAYLRREYWHGEGDFESFARLRSSIVAKIALLYVFLHLFMAISILLQNYMWTANAMVVLVVVNALLTYKRFQGSGFKTLLLNSWLNYLYFCARATSALRAFRNRRQPY